MLLKILIPIKTNIPHFITHTKLSHIIMCNLISFFQIIIRSSRYLPKKHLFSGPAAQNKTHRVKQFLITLHISLFRQILGKPETPFRPRDDSHFDQRHTSFQKPTDHRMSTLMHSNQFSFLSIMQSFFFHPCQYSFTG